MKTVEEFLAAGRAVETLPAGCAEGGHSRQMRTVVLAPAVYRDSQLSEQVIQDNQRRVGKANRRRSRLLAQYRAGASIEYLARAEGCSPVWLRRLLLEAEMAGDFT